jgi:NADH-quinone oxidoreductase subunit K
MIGPIAMGAPAGEIQALSAVLFGIGVFGFLARRNFILMLVSIEVMLNAVNLSLASFSQRLGDSRGQVLALLVIAVAAAEAGIGLGLLIALNRNRPGAGVADLTQLKG